MDTYIQFLSICKSLIIDNEAAKAYYDLLLSSKQSNRKRHKRSDPDYVYYEAHHVIPDCMFIDNRAHRKALKNGDLEHRSTGIIGGESNDKNNIVLLLPVEHAQAHIYLIDAVIPKYRFQMVQAAMGMLKGKDGRELTPDQYARIREEYSNSEEISVRGKRIGELKKEIWANATEAESLELRKGLLEHTRKIKEDPEYAAWWSEQVKNSFTEEGKARIGEKKKAYWEIPGNKEHISALSSAQMKGYWEDPEYREAKLPNMKRMADIHWSNPDARAKHSALMARRCDCPYCDYESNFNSVTRHVNKHHPDKAEEWQSIKKSYLEKKQKQELPLDDVDIDTLLLDEF